METGDLILAILTFIAIAIALGIGVRSIRQTKGIQETEHKQRLLNEIIDWAKDVINCSSELSAPIVLGVDRATLLLYARSQLYFKYRAVNARSKYIKKIASEFETDLTSAVKKVIEKMEEFIKVTEGNIEALKTNRPEDEDVETAEKCELALYNLCRALIEKTAEIKLASEQPRLKEVEPMEDDDVRKELSEIRKSLNRMEKTSRFQWEYMIGYAGIIGSVGVTALNPWAGLVVFLIGFGLLLFALRRRRK